MGHQQLSADPAQIKALTAREYGDRQFTDFRGGEDEFHMGGRLFQGLQQGIEGLNREHVHFIDNVDLEAGGGRQITHAIQQLAHVIDPGARRGIHLQDIDMARISDGNTMFTDPAWRYRRPALAVGADAIQRPCDDPRRRRLAHAPHPGQDKGMGNAVLANGIGNGTDQGILAHQFTEILGPVFARQNPVGGIGIGCSA